MPAVQPGAGPLGGEVIRFGGYPGSRAQARGYRRAELRAVCELGFHYLANGGLELAKTLFEGLVELLPHEPYVHLALGLTRDHLGDRPGADRSYARAARLDPSDPRPDLNRAELRVLAGDRTGALALLRAAHQKSRRRADPELAAKASALLGHLQGVLR